MSFNLIYGVKLSTRSDNVDIWVSVVEKENKLFFNLRQYKDQYPTINGVFLDVIEFIWLRNELLNGTSYKEMKMIRDKRSISIERKDDVIEISMEKIGLNKKGVALEKNEEEILINELGNLLKVILK